MTHQNYMKTSGIVFLIIALGHLWRVINGIPVAFGTSFIPMWVSYLAIIVAGYLSYTALKRR